MAKLSAQVRIVGAGLLGTSIGLALSKLGLDVIITSASKASAALAVDMGAGRAPRENDSPALIVVCVPPDVTAEIAARELEQFSNAVVTDVASVKSSIFEELEALGADLSRFVGSHPMAGRERGGAASGRADLFIGRPWVIVAAKTSSEAAVALVRDLADDLESLVVTMNAQQHDRAVAMVSHVPQLIASTLAGRLVNVEDSDLALAGQGLRDTTRIAASDPKLWLQIFSANHEQILPILQSIHADLASTIKALEHIDDEGSLSALARIMQAGNDGAARIPGKHGGSAKRYAQVTVMIDDRPGQLAKLLTEVGEIGINLEDLKLEHSPGAAIGLVELFVLPTAEAKLIADLTNLGWRIL